MRDEKEPRFGSQYRSTMIVIHNSSISPTRGHRRRLAFSSTAITIPYMS